jgi:hypothetical protein
LVIYHLTFLICYLPSVAEPSDSLAPAPAVSFCLLAAAVILVELSV